VNVAFNDAAASTVNVPAPAGAAEAAALDAGAELDTLTLDETDALDAADELAAGELVVDDAVVLVELHPATRVTTHSAARAATTPRKRVGELGRLTRILPEFR
jgi:hypothetical protein